ncbi:MAG: DsbA family protein [Alphaproteobacteria bacterium]|nr:DsbA family protein [Alphaproteobacteria bacterium]
MSLSRRIFSALAVSASLALAACGGSGTSLSEASSTDRTKGSPDAPITMIEYSSVACGHCASFHNDVYPMIDRDYIETGQVQFVLREMLTGSTQFAVAGFTLAHCVPEDRYFDMIGLLFQQQEAIFRAAGGAGGPRGQYLAIARSMGLSEAEFNACLNDPEINAAILANHEAAGAAGITGTPRFLFNGRMLDAERNPNGEGFVYTLGGEIILVDGEPVPAQVTEENFRTILDHLIAQAG